MKKIPSLFERDWSGDKRKVIEGPPRVDVTGAVPTRKYDGMAVMVRDGKLYRRYDAKHGKPQPEDFELVEQDDTTGHCVGWVPVKPDDPSNKHILGTPMPMEDGTYEFCGPKSQGNNEHLAIHQFIKHGSVEYPVILTEYVPIREFLQAIHIEGLVWWRDGVPIAKIKRKDFGFEWPVKEDKK